MYSCNDLLFSKIQYLLRFKKDKGSIRVFVVLRFYGPVNPMGSCRGGQFTKPHVYWKA